jgi:TolB-like protein/class 3 adenylate cyclase/tetratricopeptide (TPR) repeat protein
MTTQEFKRKLAAILSADVKGYSRLMGEDEEWTVRTLSAHREIMRGLIQQHRGRIVDAPGDNVLAEFASVVDAVQCSVEIQQVLRAKNAVLPENRRMEFRIGINLGDVIEEGEQIYGDGVNIAARLEGLAEAGGICISESAYQQIENKLPLRYKYLGEHQVKNITKPVRAYRAQIEPEAAAEKKVKPRQWQRVAIGLVVAVIVVVAAVVIWKLYTPSAPKPEVASKEKITTPQPEKPSATIPIAPAPSVEPAPKEKVTPPLPEKVTKPAPPPPPKMEVASKEKMAFPLPDKPSIAVLPFVNMSEDPKQEYFSDGMTEDIITDLSKISGLMVIARNSTFTYKGKPVKVKQVAEELGVRYVLEGSVRRSGDVIRINAQLIDAMTGVHLWAKRYDGTMNKVFALQDEITQKIVSALAVQLTGGEKEQVGLRATDNIEAYNALLEGVGHFFRYTPDGTAKAAAFFKKAIELDPNYGRAYAALAHVYYQATLFTPLLPALNMSWIEGRLRLRKYTQMALKKPTPSAYNLSALLYLSRRQHKEAIFEEERGLALDPNSRECHFNMGRVLYFAGRPKEGIEYINKSWRLDPRSRLLNLVALGWAHFCMGETAEAATFYEQALKLHPEATSTIPLAAFYAALGRDQDARAMLEMLRKKQGAVLDVGAVMFSNPFRDRAIVDRYAEGLLKAGLAPARISGGYFPASKENQLTGEEIKSLLLGSKITGIDRDGQQWWVDREKNGEFTWRGPALKDPVTQKITSAPTLAGPNSDRGKSRIEGDMICHQFEKSYWGLEFCGTVFRNPKGTNESKDEYFFCNDIGFEPFSLVR